jgi:transcriptional regulator with XRE-family HTH domain
MCRAARKCREMGIRLSTMAAVKIDKSVRKLRIEKFMSQAELSKAAGISPAHLGRIERNEHDPHLSTIRKIAKALGVDPSELIDEE